MTLRVESRGLTALIVGEDRTLWRYRTPSHFLDRMTKAGYFARVADRFRTGDFILVECPGYIEVFRLFGWTPVYRRHGGGGLLLVTETGPLGLVRTTILADSLSRFLEPLPHAKWNHGDTARQRADDTG